jgi:hypothetical protein
MNDIQHFKYQFEYLTFNDIHQMSFMISKLIFDIDILFENLDIHPTLV